MCRIFGSFSLSFSDHVDKLISDCDKRLYLLRQLKTLGKNQQGLIRFFCSYVRSLISYADPAWFPLLSDTDKIRLEKIQRTATRAIIPDMEYEERLCILQLPYLSDFLMDLSERHFNKIACDSSYPLFDRIIFNTDRMSSRLCTIYIPKRSRSQNRAKSFFPFLCLNWIVNLFYYFCNMCSMLLPYLCTHLVLSCCDIR